MYREGRDFKYYDNSMTIVIIFKNHAPKYLFKVLRVCLKHPKYTLNMV